MIKKLIGFILWWIDATYYYLRFGIKTERADPEIWKALNGSSISIIPATPEEREHNRYILEFPEMFPIGVNDANDNGTPLSNKPPFVDGDVFRDGSWYRITHTDDSFTIIPIESPGGEPRTS
jgi:hypothetical protein